MKRSRLCGYLGILASIMVILSYILISILNIFPGFISLWFHALTGFTCIILGVLSCFTEKHWRATGFHRIPFGVKTRLSSPYARFVYALYIPCTLLSIVLFLALIGYPVENYNFTLNFVSILILIVALILLLLSLIIILVAAIIYNEKTSEADKERALKRLEKRRISQNKRLEKKRKKRLKQHLEDARQFLKLENRINELNNNLDLSDKEKERKIQKLIDDSRSF
ncbi:MAG: hypothetical protein ACFE9S_16345 [Candidatus Hermodarchaeota archaeon]